MRALALLVAIGALLGVSAASSGAEPRAAEADPRRSRRAATAIHSPVAYRALANGSGGYADFRPMLARIRPILRSADLALCHVEIPMGAGAISGYPLFNAPPGLAVGIAWAGWDACSTASNHTLDQGQTGVNTTLGALTGGAYVTPAPHARGVSAANPPPRRRRLDVAFLAYTYGTNGLPLPRPWSVRLIDLRRIVADGRRARREGADLVVVNTTGASSISTPLVQSRLARAVFHRNAADVIVGQHVHVVQPIRRVRSRSSSSGRNLLSNQTPGCCASGAQDGLIALLRVRVVREAPARRRDRLRANLGGGIPTTSSSPRASPPAPTTERRRRRFARLELRRSYWRTVGYAGLIPGSARCPSPRRSLGARSSRLR